MRTHQLTCLGILALQKMGIASLSFSDIFAVSKVVLLAVGRVCVRLDAVRRCWGLDHIIYSLVLDLHST